MDSIFTKIIKREIPAEIIFEDDHTIVIPDKFPSMTGQLLVITKRQTPYVFDLNKIEYQALMQTSQKMAEVLDSSLRTLRTCLVIEGFEVSHVHVRLYPCTENKLVLEPRGEASAEALAELAALIRSALKK